MKNLLKEKAQTYGVSTLTAYEIAVLLGYKGSHENLLTSTFSEEVCMLAEKLKQEKAEQKVKINSSYLSFSHFKAFGIGHIPHEEFWIAYLNRQNKVMQTKRVSIGGISSCVVDPKIIFTHALEMKASSIIVCHNHPSGNTDPSQQDIDLTNKLKQGGRLLDIGVLDHIIVCGETYYSFADNGRM